MSGSFWAHSCEVTELDGVANETFSGNKLAPSLEIIFDGLLVPNKLTIHKSFGESPSES